MVLLYERDFELSQHQPFSRSEAEYRVSSNFHWTIILRTPLRRVICDFIFMNGHQVICIGNKGLCVTFVIIRCKWLCNTAVQFTVHMACFNRR